MAAWPHYSDMKDQLADELETVFGIEQMTVDELVGLGIALRERFWELRGCLSDVSYPYGYAARLVTAMAHEQVPDDLAVTDQYVESIETCEVTKTYHDDENARILNPVYPGFTGHACAPNSSTKSRPRSPKALCSDVEGLRASPRSWRFCSAPTATIVKGRET